MTNSKHTIGRRTDRWHCPNSFCLAWRSQRNFDTNNAGDGRSRSFVLLSLQFPLVRAKETACAIVVVMPKRTPWACLFNHAEPLTLRTSPSRESLPVWANRKPTNHQSRFDQNSITKLEPFPAANPQFDIHTWTFRSSSKTKWFSAPHSPTP